MELTYNSCTEMAWGGDSWFISAGVRTDQTAVKRGPSTVKRGNSPRITKLAKIAKNSKALITTSPKIWSR